MGKFNNNFKIAICFILFLLCLIPYVNICIYKKGVFFLVYLIIYVYFPGNFLLKKMKFDVNIGMNFLCSFYLGVSLVIIEYFILQYLNSIFVIKYIGIVISLMNIIDKIGKKSFKFKNYADINSWLVFATILFVSLYLCLFMTNFKFPYDYSIQYPDRSFQISNIAAFLTAKPDISMTVYGAEFKYHYFFYLFLAISKFIFSIDAYMLLNHYVVLCIPVLIAISFYEFLLSITKNKVLVLLFSIIAIFNCLSFKSVQYIIHLESSHNAVGFGIPLFLVLVIIFKSYFDGMNIKIKDIVIISLLVFLLTGIKGPFGLLFLASTVFYNLFYNKNYKISTLIIAIVFSFAITYVLFISSKNGNSYFNNAKFLGDISIIFFKDIYYNIDNVFFKLIIKLLFVIPNFVIQFNIFIFPVIYCFIYSILSFFQKKKGYIIYCTILAVAGIFAAYIFHITGSSNMYFVMPAYPIIAGLSAFVAEEKIIKHIKNYEEVKIIVTSLVLLFCIIVIKNLYKEDNYNYAEKFFAKPIDGFNYLFNYDELKENNDVFLGYAYIRNNTEINSILATNKQNFLTFQNDFRCHDLAAYGERHVYLEGYQYAGINSNYKDLQINLNNNSIIFSDKDINEKYGLISRLGINYIFYYKNEPGEFNPSKLELVETVFENKAVIVYKVRS